MSDFQADLIRFREWEESYRRTSLDAMKLFAKRQMRVIARRWPRNRVMRVPV